MRSDDGLPPLDLDELESLTGSCKECDEPLWEKIGPEDRLGLLKTVNYFRAISGETP